MDRKVKVLFVCLGNICRSPTAEGVFRSLLLTKNYNELIEIDSAGTHAYHVGKSPDTRAQIAAKNRGIDLSDLRGRQVNATDLDYYDYVLAMDYENYENLIAISSDDNKHKIKLFLEFAKNSNEKEVPDPYFGGDQGFERVLDLIEDAANGLLETILESRAFKS